VQNNVEVNEPLHSQPEHLLVESPATRSGELSDNGRMGDNYTPKCILYALLVFDYVDTHPDVSADKAGLKIAGVGK